MLRRHLFMYRSLLIMIMNFTISFFSPCCPTAIDCGTGEDRYQPNPVTASSGPSHRRYELPCYTCFPTYGTHKKDLDLGIMTQVRQVVELRVCHCHGGQFFGFPSKHWPIPSSKARRSTLSGNRGYNGNRCHLSSGCYCRKTQVGSSSMQSLHSNIKCGPWSESADQSKPSNSICKPQHRLVNIITMQRNIFHPPLLLAFIFLLQLKLQAASAAPIASSRLFIARAIADLDNPFSGPPELEDFGNSGFRQE
ncbi:hypothetical protein BC835DRAFT_1391526 [Cytidiella melzeri]|nr:hypothetical protein BC835DRAFT_1391526 [Cytidiella melzeri]